MAVPEQIPVVNYVADGVVKKFDVPFEYDQQSDLHVYVDSVEPTIDKYFFADNAFNFYSAPEDGAAVEINRITPKERDTDYDLHTNTVRPNALNSDFDRMWYVLQEVFSDTGGLSQQLQDEIIARIQGDDAVTEDLKNYIDSMIALVTGDPSFNGINADKVNDASGETQQQVNYNGGSKWHSRVGGYKQNERVVLTNGDIAKSTIDENTNDPNVNMVGWVKDNSASQILDASGKTQQEINDLKADKAYVDSQDSSLQLQIDQKAETVYVDAAIGAISTDASKQYATLALANADIANIALNKNVFISEAVNGGYWYKATAEATTLTKSPFDPVEVSKNYTDTTAVIKVDFDAEYAEKLSKLQNTTPDDEYAWSVEGQNGLAALFVKEDGSVGADVFGANAVSSQSLAVGDSNIIQVEGDEYAFSIEGLNGKKAVAVSLDGSVDIDRLTVGNLTVGNDATTGGASSVAITEHYDSKDTIPDNAWTWWITPLAVQMGRCIYGGGVGMADNTGLGDIKIWQKRQTSLLKAAVIGNIRVLNASPEYKTDDHNAPATLVDPRPDAKYPLIVFQSDHAETGSKIRMWRSKTADVSGLTLVGEISQTDKITYSQAYRNPLNPDEFIVVIRRDGNGAGNWRILRTVDNGDNFTEHNAFTQAGVYIGTKQSERGVLFMYQRNVMNDVDTKVALAEFRWSDYSFYDNVGAVWINNIFAQATTIAPFSRAGVPVIYESAANIFRRVFDISEVGANKVQVLLAEFEKELDGKVKLNSSLFVLLTINTSTGVVTRDASLPSAGNPMEQWLTNAYFASGCILAENDLILCQWNQPSGTSVGTLSHYTKPTSDWIGEVLDTQTHELCRPIAIERHSWDGSKITLNQTNNIVYMSGDYRNFWDMSVDTKIMELN